MSLRKSGLGSTILWETFSDAKSEEVPGWQRVGKPIVVIRGDVDQGKWLQLRGDGTAGQDGLTRSLPSEDVAGQVVRVEVKVLQQSVARIQPADLPEVRLAWREGDGKTSGASLELVTYSSPGWETCETYVAVPSGAKDPRVTLTQKSKTSTVGLDDVLVERVEPLVAAHVAGTTGTRTNLIDGGDFEVGQRNFSVYGARQVPGRSELRACPLAWMIDETLKTPVGKRSLRIPLNTDEFRLAFGWVRVVPGKTYYVSLYARASKTVRLRVGLVAYPGVFHYDYFTADEKFQRMIVEVPVKPDAAWSAAAIVVRPHEAYPQSDSEFLWIDGVSLTVAAPKETYEAPVPVEVGIVGPGFDPQEISHLVQTGKPAELSVRMTNYQETAYAGEVAFDVVDAFDQPVAGAQQTLKASVPPGQTVEEKIGPLSLPRGYYKVIATAWPGGIHQGRPHSTAERAFGVVNLSDPVPTGNYFGMTVENPRMSQRITQLGAGWVWLEASRQWSETSDGKLDWSWYTALIDRARKQNLEVLADLAWSGPDGRRPSAGSQWQTVCRGFGAVSKGKVDGVGVLDQAGLRGMPASDYVALLGEAASEIRREAGKAEVYATVPDGSAGEQLSWLKEAMKGGGLARSAKGISLRFRATRFPEDIEPALEEIRSWRKTYPSFEKYVDVAVGERGPTAYLHVPNLYGYRQHDASSRPDVEDPVLHASRLVRAMAIRQFAIIDRAAWWIESYRPPDILRPTTDPQCHEYDNAPRPCLVAFDFMAEMLNPTALTEWIDLPQQIRALCFDNADGDLVVLIWRPYGWALRPVALKGLAGKVTVYDLFGRRELHPIQGGDLTVMVNEAVRYLRVPSSVKREALEALRHPIPTTAPSALPPGTTPKPEPKPGK
ncbi:MAG: hypothetical protein JXQ73_09070 [Phycisphaerae bacterium]|nr:hypothetical protein [Phycisphaerae bacterium]